MQEKNFIKFFQDKFRQLHADVKKGATLPPIIYFQIPQLMIKLSTFRKYPCFIPTFLVSGLFHL